MEPPTPRDRAPSSPPGSASCSPPAPRWSRSGSCTRSSSRSCCCSSRSWSRSRLSAPVDWFVRRGVPRAAGRRSLTLLLFFGDHRPARRAGHPAARRPDRAARRPAARLRRPLRGQLAALLARYPDLQPFFSAERGAARRSRRARSSCSAASAASRCRCSAALALTIIFFSTVAYIVLDPAADPPRLSRQPAARLSAGRACAPIAAPAGR